MVVGGPLSGVGFLFSGLGHEESDSELSKQVPLSAETSHPQMLFLY